MKKETVANHVFARNPEVKELFVTTDGRGFYKKCDADAHAQNLKDRKVKCIKNAKGKAVKAAPATDGPKELKDMSFNELKAVAEPLEIDLSGLNSKVKLAAAIEAKQAELAKAKDESQGDGGEAPDLNNTDVVDATVVGEGSQGTDQGEEE